jgi:hypothetical protein
MDARVKVTVTAMVAGADHVLAIDVPRDRQTLEELHQLARSVAGAAGVLGERTSAVAVDVNFLSERLA